MCGGAEFSHDSCIIDNLPSMYCNVISLDTAPQVLVFSQRGCRTISRKIWLTASGARDGVGPRYRCCPSLNNKAQSAVSSTMASVSFPLCSTSPLSLHQLNELSHFKTAAFLFTRDISGLIHGSPFSSVSSRLIVTRNTIPGPPSFP